MKLVSLAIRNYRSITGTAKLKLCEGVTTLIGPNNEGKSNVLRALVTALEVSSRLDGFLVSRGGRLFGRYGNDRRYRWDTDFPIALRSTHPKGASEFDLDFELTPAEVVAFKAEVGSSLNGTLPIRISLGQDQPTFSVRKRGPGAKALSAKAGKIARFIGSRIDLQYIPAVRPASAATLIVERLLSKELDGLRTDAAYQAAVQRIEQLQLPILQKVGAQIRDTLKVFLPDVRDVQVQVPAEARYRALARSCEVIIDDGTPTSLEYKGDGVQSLAAIGLMRDSAQSTAHVQLVLAIEEPESHLHPQAIHQLRSVLAEVAKQHQVIITTHCPLFVDRHDVAANILVRDNRAAPAKSIKQIREIMGVRVSDNLLAAEVMLFVEGEEDRLALRALLAHSSPILKRSLASGVLAIDTLGGAGSLSYKLTLAREQMCVAHSLLDNDLAGKAALKRAMDSGLLDVADVTMCNSPGMSSSELEDWYDPALLAPAIAGRFGVLHPAQEFTSVAGPWSDRMKKLFLRSGKPWDDGIEMQLKWFVSQEVTTSLTSALHPARRGAFDGLVSALEGKLS